MPELTQDARNGGYIVSEGNGRISRDQVTLLTGNGVIQAGTVLGMVTASEKFIPLDQDAADGSEVAAAILQTRTDTTDADREATATVRFAEVNGALLIWPVDITGPEQNTAEVELEAVGIITR